MLSPSKLTKSRERQLCCWCCSWKIWVSHRGFSFSRLYQHIWSLLSCLLTYSHAHHPHSLRTFSIIRNTSKYIYVRVYHFHTPTLLVVHPSLFFWRCRWFDIWLGVYYIFHISVNLFLSPFLFFFLSRVRQRRISSTKFSYLSTYFFSILFCFG